ncbi:MAG: hypothetical protein ACLUQ0_08665 [Enterococcus italicus]|uniref:hypothetical protein n=1 Tax=Enterococcus italicus TaxID=246144 RepID=UPI0039920BBE
MNKVMKKVQKIGVLLGVLFISYIFVGVLNVEASDILNNSINDNNTVQVIDSDRVLSKDEITDLLNKLEESKDKGTPMLRATGVSITYYLIRSGNTKSCELIAAFNATGALSHLWWQSLTVQNTNILNRTTYGVFNQVLRSAGSKTKGTVSIGFLSIPTGITSAYLKAAGTQAESNKDGWGSLVNFNGTVRMN